MATFVVETLDKVDSAIEGYAESVFADFGGAVSGLMQAMGIVGLAFIAFNTLVQWVPIRVTEYTRWMDQIGSDTFLCSVGFGLVLDSPPHAGLRTDD